MIEKKETISVWNWYKIIMDSGAEYLVRIQDFSDEVYYITEYYDGRIMTTGSLAKCKKWIEDRRVK